MGGSQFRPLTCSIRKSAYRVKISNSKKVDKRTVMANPDIFNENLFY